MGQIYFEKSPLKGRCANTLKQMIKESRTRKWIQKEMERHTAAHAMGEEEDICAKLDLQLLREMRNLAARKGKMTYYVKIMHRIIATNVELVKRNQKDTDECKCCGKQSETLNHILGHCDCEQIKEERGEMLRNVRDIITKILSETKASTQLKEAITEIWSNKTIEHMQGESQQKAYRRRTSKMAHIWEKVKDTEWLMEITRGWARNMRDAIFTTDFIKGLEAFGVSNDKAKKLALGIHEQILEGKIGIIMGLRK